MKYLKEYNSEDPNKNLECFEDIFDDYFDDIKDPLEYTIEMTYLERIGVRVSLNKNNNPKLEFLNKIIENYNDNLSSVGIDRRERAKLIKDLNKIDIIQKIYKLTNHVLDTYFINQDSNLQYFIVLEFKTK